MRSNLHSLCRTALFLFLAALATHAFADLETGSIGGIVVDEVGNGLPRTDIFLMDAAGIHLIRSVTSDTNGRFLLDDVLPGEYMLRAEKRGFQPQMLSGARVLGGRIATAPFILETGKIAPTTSQPLLRPAQSTGPDHLGNHPQDHPVGPSGADSDDQPADTQTAIFRGTIQDALKDVDQRAGLFEPDEYQPLPGRSMPRRGPVSVSKRFSADLLWLGHNTGDLSSPANLEAEVAGTGASRGNVWSLHFANDRTPALFLEGPARGLSWRPVKTIEAGVAIGRSKDNANDSPERTFRLDFIETEMNTSGEGVSTFRSYTGGSSFTLGEDATIDLNLIRISLSPEPIRTSGLGDISRSGPGGEQDGSTFMGFRVDLHRQWSYSNRAHFAWHHGISSGDSSDAFLNSKGGPGPYGTVVSTPMLEGTETMISGSNQWMAASPLEIFCNLEYRRSGDREVTQTARPWFEIKYAPFTRTHLSSRLGLAIRAYADDRNSHDLSTMRMTGTDTDAGRSEKTLHGGMEYALGMNQTFGRGYLISIDAAVQDLLPSNLSQTTNPVQFDVWQGNHLFIGADGVARSTAMNVSIEKSFGTIFSGLWGATYLEGEGDILALPAFPAHGSLANDTSRDHRVRCISGRLNTNLPWIGTGFLFAYNYMSNLDTGLLSENGSLSSEFSRLDLGFHQRLPFLQATGMDWLVLMSISSLSLNDVSLDGLLDSMTAEKSDYRRITGGLKVKF